jgi:hypothetical protein
MYAKGAVGPAAMVAAAVDGRVAELAVERSIVSYMDVVAARIHEGLDQTVVPGILGKADLPEVLRLMGGRPATLISPAHPNGRPMLRGEAPKAGVVLRGEGWSLRRTMPGWLP